MKRLPLFIFIFSIGFVNSTKIAFAQADETMKICANYLVPPFISDGQQYKALLNEDEIAEFHITFFGGSTYRLITASGTNEGNVIFRIYDKERNLLFTNSSYENSTYWDFKFSSTIDCIIEAQLDNDYLQSGFLVLLVGFKQN